MQEYSGNGNGNGNVKVPDSVVRIELISFYHRNPDFYETSEGIVKNFGYLFEQVHEQLENLVRLKILEKIMVNDSAYYRYLPPISCKNLKSIHYLPGVNGFKGATNVKDEELDLLETT